MMKYIIPYRIIKNCESRFLKVVSVIKDFYPKSILAGVILFFCNSCSFLEVDALGIVDRDKMFQNTQGYRDALIGVYAMMSSPDLYGEALSFGFIDEIAQLYYNDYEHNETTLTKTYSLRYTDREVRNRINHIWLAAYNSIACLNSLLDYADNHQQNLPTLNVIRGEALALRAFLHFDLLRLFAPLNSDSNTLTIPYVRHFSKTPQPKLSLEKFYQALLEDINQARKLLLYNQDELPVPIYMNFDATSALLARIHLWRGNLLEAKRYAQELTNKEQYSLVHEEEIASLFNGYNAKSECIWALHAPRLYLSVRDRLYPSLRTPKMNMVRTNYQQIFKVGRFSPTNNDYRYQAYFTQTNWGKTVVTLTKLYDKNYDELGHFVSDRVPSINMFRLPELYYILAECYYSEDKTKSLEAINTVVTARGLKPFSLKDIASKTNFEQILLEEIIKEYWAEGQIFFTYKRLKHHMEGLNNHHYLANDATFRLPLPEDESKYGI